MHNFVWVFNTMSKFRKNKLSFPSKYLDKQTRGWRDPILYYVSGYHWWTYKPKNDTNNNNSVRQPRDYPEL